MTDPIDWQVRAVAAEVELAAYMSLYGEALLEIAGLQLEANAAVERAFCDAALAFADAKASIEDQAAEYKRTLAALQAARGAHA